jgi:hypothetical protein
VAGSTNLNGITDWKVGDWAVYNGTAWQKIDNTDSVTSVNGFTGAVVLTNTDISGFGTMSTQNANAIAVTGGTINGTTIGATTATTGAFTTVTASTSLTTPTVQATNSGGLALKNSGGTTQMSVGAGGGDNMSINVSTNINGTNAQIDISPTGTGHVHIKPSGTNSVEIAPTSVGTINNMTIGATTAVAGSFTDLSVTGTTSFDGSQGTAGQVLTSAGTGATPTWTTPTTGTVTSVTGTAPVVSSGGATPAISMAAANTTTNGYLTSTDWNTFNGKGSGTVTSVAALTLGTTGTDLSSTVATGTTTPVITLQVPTASASNRGALSSTDWSTFNGKQAALVSGTNIKTINTNSILGSGDLTISGTPAGSTTQVQYNSSGAFAGSANLTFDGTNLTAGGINTPNTFGFKNRIINGNMAIDQRNGGASITPTNTQYSVDRWQSFVSAASKFTIQQNAGSVTPPVGYVNYLGATSSSAYSVASGDYFTIQQRIEGLNVADLAWGSANAKTITLSAWVYSSLTGTFGGAISNSAQNRSYPFTYTISSANTWTQISVTITGDTTGTWLKDNGNGMFIVFSLGTGTTYSGTAGSWAATAYLSATSAVSVVGTSGATFYITGVQVETGTKATSFDFRDYGRELILCQRYYQIITGFMTASGSGSTGVGAAVYFAPQMRTSPTVSLSAALQVTRALTSDFTQSSSNIAIAASGARVSNASVDLDFSNFSGLPTDAALPQIVTGGSVLCSAEL